MDDYIIYTKDLLFINKMKIGTTQAAKTNRKPIMSSTYLRMIRCISLFYIYVRYMQVLLNL